MRLQIEQVASINSSSSSMASLPASDESDFRSTGAHLFRKKGLNARHSPPPEDDAPTGRPQELSTSASRRTSRAAADGTSANHFTFNNYSSSISGANYSQWPSNNKEHAQKTSRAAGGGGGGGLTRAKSVSSPHATRFRVSLKAANSAAAPAAVQPYLNCVRSLEELESNRRRVRERRVSFSDNILILERDGQRDVVKCETLK